MFGEGNAASSVLGWISIACWIVVYSPQIIENYQLQSGEGLSLLFIYVWLLGDVCNLAGAVMAGLLPTVIILGVYYTLCDTVLLCQVYYYRWKRQTGRHVIPAHISGEVSEDTCLLGDSRSVDPSERPEPSITRIFVRYLAAVAFVSAAGVAAYCISNWLPNNDTSPVLPNNKKLDWNIQIIGWTSATAYLGARLPQIVKNSKTRCEGLAPGLFVFSILGNSTYALSIIVASRDPDYLIRNASWLAGSGLTIFLDILVLGQFFYYGFVSAQRGWIDNRATA
ncbi:PQ-loop-domain-containing protein [Suillus paluster]|uniref:PQ-loop-domain-containing protein n=1 Tax=Suillus paluster TaxID=48578 RepID=UPI001B86AF58|nr:PQ-loop-domain-containing protein [Suillus paluster]KAG1745985.1 PQ-loop-domain-containing protein [Suillus paluster]